MIDALVQQGGVDLPRCEVSEAGRTQQIEHAGSFLGVKRTRRSGS